MVLLIEPESRRLQKLLRRLSAEKSQELDCCAASQRTVDELRSSAAETRTSLSAVNVGLTTALVGSNSSADSGGVAAGSLAVGSVTAGSLAAASAHREFCRDLSGRLAESLGALAKKLAQAEAAHENFVRKAEQVIRREERAWELEERRRAIRRANKEALRDGELEGPQRGGTIGGKGL